MCAVSPEPASAKTTRRATRRDRRYWLRLMRLFTFAASVVIIGLPALAGALPTYVLVYHDCTDSGERPDAYGHAWEAITLKASAGGSFRGYFVPGTNGATIIFPPTYADGLNSRLAEADVLIRHGYAVFGFESRRCANMGPSSLGYKEVDEVGDVLRYLLARDDIDPTRIGIHGFSSAGATAIMAAARYPQLRAVVAEGGYADLGGLVDSDNSLRYPETLMRLSVRLTYRLLLGVSLDDLSPLHVIQSISPRPILLIYGSNESSLPGAYEQLAAAGDSAELWVVEGAGHGNYLSVAPEEYERHVLRFFDRALLQTTVQPD